MKEFFAKKTYTAEENSIIETLDIRYLLSECDASVIYSENFAQKANIGSGGWQSWSACFETEPSKKQLSGNDCILKSMRVLLDFPETKFKPTKNVLLCPFICYLRKDDFYLALISTGSTQRMQKTLPPVQFIVNRKKGTVAIELCDKGKVWQKGEKQAQIEICTFYSYFEFKDKLAELFDEGQFEQLEFLHGTNVGTHDIYGTSTSVHDICDTNDRTNDNSTAPTTSKIGTKNRPILGWESWYNHYTQIDENLILKDLDALSKKETVLHLMQNSQPIIFQIDDGWETAVGDWTIHSQKFPNGLKDIVEKIEKCSFIPGLWIAPFLLYDNSPIATSHPDWILRDKKKNPVVAGVNPGWNGLKPLRCLDLSNENVLNYLDSIMERAINEWGFRYIKLDFMYAGMLYGNFSNGGSQYEWYSKAIKILTRRKTTKDGKPVTYLGCGIPMEMSYHEFPLSRIGCDTREHWNNSLLKLIKWSGRNEAHMNLKDTLGRALWDKTIYENDPDVIFIRNKNCSLSHNEKMLIALVNFIFASQIMYSDDPSENENDEETKLSQEIVEICRKLSESGEDFSVKMLQGGESYEIKSRSGKFFGTINLGGKSSEKHTISINSPT